MRIAVGILALAACIPDIETVDARLPDQGRTLLLAEERFEAHYGVEVDAFAKAGIHWTATVCPYTDGGEWSVVVYEECFWGVTWDCGEIYVAMNRDDPGRTCPTALVHEFFHCLSLEADMGLNPGHSNEELWDLMGEVHSETCDRGW